MSSANADPEIFITRVFKAPRDLVFKAFTEAERLAHWWGPKGFAMRTARLDLRPGGTFLYGMASPGGQEMWGKFVYREIVPPERLVYVNSFCDEQGTIMRHPLAPTWPLEVLNTLTFEESDGKTILTMRGRPLNASDEETQTFAAAQSQVQAGLGATLNQLDEYLEQAL